MMEPRGCATCCRSTAVRSLLDAAISLIVVFPLILLYWSATWKFLDVHLFPHQPYSSATICLLIGVFITISSYYILPVIGSCVMMEDLHTDYTKHIVLSRMFIYLSTMGYLFLWRGVWMFIDKWSGHSLKLSIVVAATSLVLHLIFRTTSSVLFSPLVLFVDATENFYQVKTRFGCEMSSVLPYCSDVLFTSLIIHPLVVATWIGLWNILDLTLWPRDPEQSYIVCTIAGLIGIILIFLFQKPLIYTASKLHTRHKVLEIVFSGFMRVIFICVCVVWWRGCWGYTKDYIFTTKVIGDWPWLLPLSHVAGMVLVMCVQAGNTLAAVGCSVDSPHPEQGGSVKLQVEYFKHYCCHFLLLQQYTVQESTDEERQALLHSGTYPDCEPVYAGF